MAPTVNVNSYSFLIQLGWLERMKLIPPFAGAAKYALTPAEIIQAEHVPYVGCYLSDEKLGPDGDANHAEPRFTHTLQLGFSYIIVNNNPDQAAEMLDAAHWSFMKLLHDPSWHTFSNGVVIESVTGGSRKPIFGNIGHNNETPVAEVRMEMTYVYKTYFEPIVTDIFERMHTTTQPWPTDIDNRQSIITEWVLDQ